MLYENCKPYRIQPRFLAFCLLLVGLVSLESCATVKKEHNSRVTKTRTQLSKNSIRQDVVATATSFIGNKYRYGGKGDRGFDCSGLVCRAFYENKIDIRGNSRSLASQGVYLKLDEAQKGDLIFFKKKNKINHVALITDNLDGELWVVHSTSSRGVIREDIFASSYWSSKEYVIKDLLLDVDH